MATDSLRQDQASARAGLRRAAAEAAGRGDRLRLDAHTVMLILRATGAADLAPEVLIGLLATSLGRRRWPRCWRRAGASGARRR